MHLHESQKSLISLGVRKGKGKNKNSKETDKVTAMPEGDSLQYTRNSTIKLIDKFYNASTNYIILVAVTALL